MWVRLPLPIRDFLFFYCIVYPGWSHFSHCFSYIYTLSPKMIYPAHIQPENARPIDLSSPLAHFKTHQVQHVQNSSLTLSPRFTPPTFSASVQGNYHPLGFSFQKPGSNFKWQILEPDHQTLNTSSTKWLYDFGRFISYSILHSSMILE